MNQPIGSYIKAATESGYDVSNDNIAAVYETKDSFFIVAENDNEGNWLIGQFVKSTEKNRGDYTGVPVAEAATSFECMQKLEMLIQERIIASISDWESSCLFNFIEDLLQDVDYDTLLEISERQGF